MNGGGSVYRAKHLIGLPVVNVATGERLASVRSLVIDLVSGHLQALVVHKGSLFREPQALKLTQLHAMGQDAILVKDGEKTIPLPTLLGQLPNASTEDRLFGRQVLTAAGKVLGALEDVFFDPVNGSISHYMLADGLLQSLLQGPAIMPAPKQPVIGEEHVIVPENPEWDADQLTMSISSLDWQ